MQNKPRVGAQLYTVREFAKTESDLRETLKKVRAIGYSVVQVSGIGPIAPEAVAEAAREAGVTIGATHFGWDRFLKDLDGLIAQHRLWDCNHLAIGGLPRPPYEGEEGMRKFIREVQPIAARLRAEGMDFSYHNHNHEFFRPGKMPLLELLYAESDPADIKAELDTYWVQAGGGCPAHWLRKCAGREPVIHLKDMCITQERVQRFAAIGDGNLNWPDILKAAEEGGVEYMMVESDDCYGEDPFESLARSYRFLNCMGYA